MEKNKIKFLYQKLNSDGIPHSSQLDQLDYDNVVKFIKKGFPQATRVQKEIESTLKRTFILGKRVDFKESKKFKRNFPLSELEKARKRYNRQLEKSIPKKLNFEGFIHLNNLWTDYIKEVLRNENQAIEIQNKLNRVDYHGSLMKVTENAKCKDFNGLEGIVIKETKNTFVFVTKSNLTKTIPKKDSIFEVEISGININGKMIVSGNSILTRPAERIVKKIKSFLEYVGPDTYKSYLRYGLVDDESFKI